MSYTLHVRPVVTRETATVHAYYEQQSPGLGDRFLKALRECYLEIQHNPYRYPVRRKNYRHLMVRRFRYRVVYEVEGSEIHVYQLRHTSRKPSKRYGP